MTTINRNAPPNFRTYESGPDFDRAREQIATPFQYVDVALDVAAANQVLNISGDFLYLDAISSGAVTLELNNQWNDAAAPFYAQPGFGINAIFKQVKLSWVSQPGKKVRIMYSTGDRIVPTNSTSINGSVSVSESGFVYGGAFSSITQMVANTPQTIFTPAQNANGAIIWAARFFGHYGVSNMPNFSLIAKTTAPATVVDGDVLMCNEGPVNNGNIYMASGKLDKPVKVPAGKGAYFISTFSDYGTGYGIRHCLYTLL